MTQLAWVWPGPQVMRALHEEQLAEHGGAGGIADPALFDAAIGPGLNRQAGADLAALAAACGCALLHHQPFVDGNQRTAFVAIELFLALNGWELLADDGQCVLTMLNLEAGDLSQDDLAHWLRQHMAPRKDAASLAGRA